MVEVLSAVIIVGIIALFALLLWVAFRVSRTQTPYDPNTLQALLQASIAQSSDVLRGAFASSIQDLGLHEDIGAIKNTAKQILDSSQNLQTLFEVKRGRAQFAEFQLEEILRDLFPPGKVHIQKRVEGFGTPDAHIVTSDGILCIDAKFPLDNYRRMVDTQDPDERKRHAKAFASDVRGHVDKIARDYVRPERGGLPFALGFIPSEAIYQYLTEAEGDLLREAASRGVNLVSPSTIVATLNLLAITMRAQEIAEKAEEIQEGLQRLERGFKSFEGHWGKMKTHLSNAYRKMADADKSYTKLLLTYRRVARLEEEESE
jgi:DNA recombination protein RmuC